MTHIEQRHRRGHMTRTQGPAGLWLADIFNFNFTQQQDSDCSPFVALAFITEYTFNINI